MRRISSGRWALAAVVGIAAAGCAAPAASPVPPGVPELASLPEIESAAIPLFGAEIDLDEALALPASAGPASLHRVFADPAAADPPAAEEKRPEGRTSEMPKVEVLGDPVTSDSLVGENRQPEWTTRRPFVRSRVYVLAPWQVELETWSRTKYENGDQDSGLFQQEISLGLPYRFQVDYYHNFKTTTGAGYEDAGPQVEARWAFAEWGKIPLNPTLYGEYKWDTTGADKYEAKLLLGDSLAPRWHAAANLILEQETSGARATELAVSGAMSYELLDRRLMVGAEVTAARVTESGSRDHPSNEIAAGPSLQIRITERIHLDVVPMFGVSKDATDVDLFIVFGIDLGGGDEKTRLAPLSRKSQ